MLPRLAITAGEPAGIGPELVARLAASDLQADLVAIADQGLVERAALACRLDLELTTYDGAPVSTRKRGTLRVAPVPLPAPECHGQPDTRNARYVLDTVARAADGCLAGEFVAMVTAPLHKGVINDAGVPFSGHTEFLARRAHAEVLMMLAGPHLRVALATTHLPLSAVPAAITGDGLARDLGILQRGLRDWFALPAPRIAVLGLNPHAGEGGHLGREELEIIAPLLERLREDGMALLGPLPADTAFLPATRGNYDAVLAMYHDQALPVLKAEAFDSAVNVTLGLPFVRTSVDHGTALDIAGLGQADASSMIAAARMAMEIDARRNTP